MLEQDFLGNIIRIGLVGNDDVLNGVHKEEEEDHDKHDLKEQRIEMTHHPPGTVVINLPHFIHKIIERHHSPCS
jgi:hypothetical protein